MKKILVASVLALCAVAPAMAQHHGGHGRHGHYGHHHRHWHPHYGWVAPMVIGGVVTYALTRPQVVVDQPPVVVQQPPVVVQSVPVDPLASGNCTAWREVQQADGTITRERTCYSR